MSTIKFRRAHSSEWLHDDPTLSLGEPGYEYDTCRFKIGDGKSKWTQLSYFSSEGSISDSLPEEGVSDEALRAHIQSQTPHPVYDSGPSFLFLYQNAKV